MTPEALYSLAPPLTLLQLLAVGWRVNRELHAAEADKQPVIPLPDVLNILSLFATLAFAIILPITTDSYLWLSRMVLGGAYVVIGFHPLTVAAHYRLWRRDRRSRHVPERVSSVYVNREELALSLVSVLLAIIVAAYIGMHG